MSAVIGSLRAELSASVAQFVADMNKAANSVSRVAKRAKRVGQTMQSAGRTMSIGLTLPVVAFGASTLKAAGNFEAGMNRVAAISNATAKQFADMRAEAKDLGATTQYSATQAADAMGFLAQAGFKANGILKAEPKVLQLAASAQMDLGRTADIVSNILQGYGLKVKDLGHANDVLVKTFTSSNTNLEQLGEAMKYAAPVASTVGIKFEEAAAAIGLMGNAGIQGTMAGTSLRGAIVRLLAPSGKAEKAMKKMGMSAQEGAVALDGVNTAASAKAMRDLGIKVIDPLTGKMLPLKNILLQFQRAFGGVSKKVLDANGELRDQKSAITALTGAGEKGRQLMTIFGQRAGPAFAALLAQGSGALEKLTGDLENSGGTAKKIADVQMKGYKGAVRGLKSAIENLQITLADSGLLQWMTDFVKSLTGFIRGLAKTNPAILKFATVMAGIVATVGPALFIFGGMAKGFGILLPLIMRLGVVIGPVISAVGSFVVALRAGYSVVQALGLVFAANPIGLALIGIAAAAVAVYEAWKHWGAIKAFVTGVATAVGDWLEKKTKPILNALAPVIDFLAKQFRLAGKMIMQVVHGDFMGALSTFGKIWKNAFDAAVSLVGRAVGAIGDWLKNKLAAIIDWVGKKVRQVTDFFRNMYEAVVGHSFVPDMVRGIIAWFAKLDKGMVAPARKAAGSVNGIMKKMSDGVGRSLADMVMHWDFSLSSILNMTKSLASQLFLNPFGNFLSSMFSGAFSGMFGGSSGAGGSFISDNMSSAFGGFAANGAVTDPGKAYIVGERGPELFVPKSRGEVIPNGKFGGRPQVVMNVKTADAQSFLRSESQIAAMMTRALAHGQRNM
ncbi:MAG TPA: phage tail tape measure protein [Alphaproteobacteria bacterium]|nr:phage tail tape measure protein [Alphaproteobacteria bacterium]